MTNPINALFADPISTSNQPTAPEQDTAAKTSVVSSSLVPALNTLNPFYSRLIFLPLDAQIRILSYLELTDMVASLLQPNAVVPFAHKEQVEFHLSHNQNRLDASRHYICKQLGSLPAPDVVDSLDLGKSGTSDNELEGLVQEYPYLRTLKLAGRRTQVTDASLIHLQGLHCLQKLTLKGCAITNETLTYLSNLPLQDLTLYCNNEPFTLDELRKLPLTHLTLVGRRISNADLAQLRLLPGLTHLTLSRCSFDDDADLSQLPHSIEHLDLSFSAVNNDHLRQLHRLPLTYLDLMSTAVTDEGLVYLSEMPLETLILSQCPITDQGLPHLSRLPLKSLDLSGTLVYNDGLLILQQMTQLQSLSVSGCVLISDDGLVHLQELPQLHSLNLSGCSITRDGLIHLRDIALHTLTLVSCNELTDGDLLVQLNGNALRHLNIQDTRISPDCALLLQERFPHLTVEHAS